MEYSKKELYDPKTDPVYQHPVIDVREERERPLMDGSSVKYQYLHGYFEGTNVKFVFCFPEKDQFQWRFYQHLSPFPGPDEELASLPKTGEDDVVSFALTHGGAFVESNMGSGAVFGSESDPRIFYRSSAAVAEYCRVAAQEIFGKHRIYGYVFGGSGGGYKTMSCIENTASWDGAVPYVIGSPVSLPNCLTLCAHGGRLLRHVSQQIADALEPGGSGDIYAGLNQEEKAALEEIVKMGFPPHLAGYLTAGDDGSLPVLAPTVKMMDPEYFTDFWTKPGYLGTEPDSNAVRDRIYLHTKVVCAGVADASGHEEKIIDDRNGTDDAWRKMMTDGSSAFIEVEEAPQGEDLYLRGVDIIFESGKAKGKKLRLGSLSGNRLIPGMSFGSDDIAEVIGMIEPGDEVFLDNSDYIAIQSYHRHQVPEDPSFHAWDQYKDAEGKPIYPQRPTVISYGFTAGGCGSVQDGQIQCKTIVINNLSDGDFPWQADWYRRKVESIYGDNAKDCFRLWYNANAPHGDADEVGDNLHIISYLGMLHQALVDVAAWVENGEAPADTSGYDMVDNQVKLYDDPVKRSGIQPMVDLAVNGEICTKVKAGEEVHVTAKVIMGPWAGEFESAEFSFEGEQDFPYTGTVTKESADENCRYVEIETSHVFPKPGRYYAVVRVISNRKKGDGYTRLRNLARACIIVD